MRFDRPLAQRRELWRKVQDHRIFGAFGSFHFAYAASDAIAECGHNARMVTHRAPCAMDASLA